MLEVETAPKLSSQPWTSRGIYMMITNKVLINFFHPFNQSTGKVNRDFSSSAFASSFASS